jgi:Domain of unknown function (DUF2017)
MRIVRTDPKTVSVGPLDLLYCEFLHQIHAAADPGDDDAARQRLFPSPTGGKDSDLDRDWLEYVEPELADWFTSCLQVVERDLRGFPGKAPSDLGYTLRIPFDHLDAWIHALNQARITIGAKYNFSEADMNDEIPVEGQERSLALFQEHFYGVLIECFLRILDGSGPHERGHH